MRAAHLIVPRVSRLIVAALAVMAAPVAAHAQDVTAAAPHDLSVTIYRNPYRGAGGFDLNNLGGFALVTETRRIVLTPGEHRLRFEGVADGIDPASAIVTGLPSGVIEKNRDAALLSPSALVDMAQERGGRVAMARTDPGTGKITRRQGTIRSAADGGVVFETPDGIEALRCSGLPETFAFDRATTGLSAKPTLSVLTRTTKRIEAVVQLSYLARGFDWAADYVVGMTPPGKFNLGGWVTLANGNGISFKDARVQVVAGRLNRETGDVEPIDIGQPILASCWPQGSTSDTPPDIYIERAYPLGFDPMMYPPPAPMAAMAMDKVVVTGSMLRNAPEDAALPVEVSSAEDLGDLKLYRVPNRTTVASRQSKQIRLLDRAGVPVKQIYEADFTPNYEVAYRPMTILLRTKNDKANNLGLPLPSGRVAVFETVGTGAAARRLLSGETSLRDLAVDEETELRLGASPDVQVRQVVEKRDITGTPQPAPPVLPGVDTRGWNMQQVGRIEITNARPFPIQVEVRLALYGNQTLVSADHPAEQKNGRPIFRVTVPANDELDIRYQTATR